MNPAALMPTLESLDASAMARMDIEGDLFRRSGFAIHQLGEGEYFLASGHVDKESFCALLKQLPNLQGLLGMETLLQEEVEARFAVEEKDESGNVTFRWGGVHGHTKNAFPITLWTLI